MAAYGANFLRTPHNTRIRPARALKLLATTTAQLDLADRPRVSIRNQQSSFDCLVTHVGRTVAARAAPVRFRVHRITPSWNGAVNRTGKSEGCILTRRGWPDLNRATDSLE